MIFYYDPMPYKQDKIEKKVFEEKLETWAKNVEKKFEEKNSYTTTFNYNNFDGVFGSISVTPNYISVTQKTKTSEGEKVYFLKDVSSITMTNKNEKESFIELNFATKVETVPVLLEPSLAKRIIEMVKRNVSR